MFYTGLSLWCKNKYIHHGGMDMKINIKKLFDDCVADGIAPEMAKAVIESMIHTANEYHMVQEMFKGYIKE